MNIKNELKAFRYGLGRYREFRKNPDYLKWYYEERQKLMKFHNIHEGEDCIIIGNGPSLNKMGDLSVLNEYYTFGMNKIYLIFKRFPLKLSYYVSVNNLVIEQSIGELERIQCPLFLSYRNADKIKEKNTDLNFLFTKGGNEYFAKDICQQIFESGTVTYVALQLAYFMGFQNVYLIGVDHNFVQIGKPNSRQKLRGNDENHFDPEYFSGKNWNLADLDSSEFGYYLAKKAFEANGRKIYDATVEGKLDIFEKIDYNQFLKQMKKKHL